MISEVIRYLDFLGGLHVYVSLRCLNFLNDSI